MLISEFIKEFISFAFQYLDLSFGRLQVIESDAFEHLVELVEFDISYNELQNLSFAIFNGLTNLQKLMIAGNQIAHLDGSIARTLPNLRIIDLSHNMITVVWIYYNFQLIISISSYYTL